MSEKTAAQQTILEVLRWSTAYFKSLHVEDPGASAEILLAWTLGVGRIDLYARHDHPVVPAELDRFKSLVKRRAGREPVAYIVGEKEFWSMGLAVTPAVLIPRPETECLVEAALEALAGRSKKARILEVGTGSGAIAIALASERRGDVFFVSDCSADAVSLARKNAERHGLREQIRFFCASWMDALAPERAAFDMVISNPPYIRSGDITGLQPEVSQYEPRLALDGGADGLSAIRHIIRGAHDCLIPGGDLLLEIGYDQKESVKEIMTVAGGYDHAGFRKDYAGQNRVAHMKKKA
jgi:release factor glutamine methyltransferase